MNIITKEDIIAAAKHFTNESQMNYVSKEAALSEDYVGMKIFDSPIFAFGNADDMLYDEYKSPDIIGEHFLSPLKWLPEAKTVISFFLPYADKIKYANSLNLDWPADEWLHGRIEGQFFLKELTIYIHNILSDAGYKSLIPNLDPRFKTGDSRSNNENTTNRFTSNWSERHIAYACGLGTFGLSKGLITEKGVCGRFGSILTELDLEKDIRAYKDVYEYCTMCGLCIINCPVNAITKEGKNDLLCSDFLDKTFNKHNPRYGCGKCQVSVPCESRAPSK
ncbi:MAG: 4Fe-4S binding protein [Defluviitaleaceae bacterium]|nr:4Fe-4S binding protein [Defluviitaleaceae bacterium]